MCKKKTIYNEPRQHYIIVAFMKYCCFLWHWKMPKLKAITFNKSANVKIFYNSNVTIQKNSEKRHNFEFLKIFQTLILSFGRILHKHASCEIEMNSISFFHLPRKIFK